MDQDVRTADRAPEPAPGPGPALPDVQALQAALRASLETQVFLERVLNASKDCIKVLTLDGRLVFMNGGGREVMEVDDFDAVRGCPWLGFWEGEGREAAEAALAEALAGETGHFLGWADTAKGNPKYWDVTVSKVAGAGQEADYVLSISRDITDLKKAERRRELLARELGHRVKNSLALAQAIGMQTFRGVDVGRIADFNGRLAALGAAQDLLLQSEWTPVSVRSVVQTSIDALAPGGRCEAVGDDHQLDAQRGLSLALALHELTTNALKYGALSVEAGTVRIEWTAAGGLFRLSWRESGGPPVAPPGRTGFGTRIVTRNLETDFGGTVELSYRPTGVQLTLTAPI
jgi:PAS domain S-box-containing protein